MDLSKEYFDQQNKVTREHLDRKFVDFEKKIDQKFETQTKELKGYIHESFETQQVYMDHRFDELVDKMQIKDRLDQHEYWIDKIADKAGVSLGK